MSDHTKLLEDLDKCAKLGLPGFPTECAEAIRELEELLADKQESYESLFRTLVKADMKIIKLEEKIKELEGWNKEIFDNLTAQNSVLKEQVKECKQTIESYLDGNYPHPRNFRPDDCPHGVRYWMDCGSCDEEFWQTHLTRIKTMGLP